MEDWEAARRPQNHQQKTSKENLLTTIDMSPELSPVRRALLEKILLKNELAFGLDGRLGHYLAKGALNFPTPRLGSIWDWSVNTTFKKYEL
ncbi:hypothetical protein M422DRAFT_261544 [Sphaerobolus stellatus SS14]|uniref:Unplaced genomic scaffold SPHSTscaffold_106, whole genome shotgun sequence n=1 Tax=Sphaerobolus stellatus (strain SS14) TaxID=990650 RepID=A0A0C9U0B3_SPHS4|nr:hypothetical protein M422DRAFT_261544 [Sphaerobolus stellatus SS14]